MGTKWKNTASIKKLVTFIKEKKLLIIAVAAGCVGCSLYDRLFQNYRWVSTGYVWKWGILADILLGISLFIIVNHTINYIYKGWLPKDESFYSEWESKWNRQQNILALFGLMLALVCVFFFMHLKNLMVWDSLWNYAMGYFLTASAAALYALCQLSVVRFMRGRLNLLMKRMAEINKESLEKAIEIERQSIERANKSEQLKIDLISNVSHDLKTPLTSMVGYLELLKMENLNPVAEDYVEVISDKAEKLKEMIESLFSLAKASSGNMTFKFESIELNRLIEQIFADMEDRIEERQLHFVKLMTEEDTHFISDNIYMYRICQNLIENALKYSAKGTRVFVKTYMEKTEAEENLCMEIVNTAGYYMDFSKDDIVERFARGDKARTSEGNGLGLAIVSTYASALGGKFDISIDCDQFKAILKFPVPEGEK